MNIKSLRFVSVSIFFLCAIGSIAYAGTSGFRLISIGGNDFASFFSSGATMGIEADSFHDKTNDTWLSHPLDGNNYLGGDTYFGLAGSNTGVITASGNVGIGTTSPDSTFEVVGSARLSAPAGGNVAFNIYTNAQTNNNITLGQGFATAIDNIGYLYNRANADFVLGTANTDMMWIKANGNIGIGTNSPASLLTLSGGSNNGLRINNGTVNGVVFNTSNASMSVGTVSNHPLGLYTNNTQQVTVSTGGYVGIGTTNPGARLYIDDAGINPTGAYLGIRGGYPGYSGSSGTSLSIRDKDNTSDFFTIKSNYSLDLRRFTSAGVSASSFYVSSNGNVGIGNINPTAKLEVNGNIIASDPTAASHVATKAYVDAQVGAAGGGSKSQIFASNGTWVKPAGVSSVRVLLVGGGGGAGGGECGGLTQYGATGGGGGGGEMVLAEVPVSGNVAITIGAGGVGGIAGCWNTTDSTSGTSGGDTSFGSLIIARGGAGGTRGNGGDSSGAGWSIGAGGAGGGVSGSCTSWRMGGGTGGAGIGGGSTTGNSGVNGCGYIGIGSGGGSINTPYSNRSRGSGGGGSYGTGAAGRGLAVGDSAAANSGGGGGSGGGSSIYYGGGNGGSGYAVVFWNE